MGEPQVATLRILALLCPEIFPDHLIRSGHYIFLLIKVQYTDARSQLSPDAFKCKFVAKKSMGCLPKHTL